MSENVMPRLWNGKPRVCKIEYGKYVDNFRRQKN